jgi:YesN/AraC family two-component response regulator
MPEMDGIALLRTMRDFDFATSVVIATAFGDVPNAAEAMRYGAIDFLQKPVLPEELRKLVFEILERHHPALLHVARNDFESHLKAAKRLLNLREFEGAKEHLIKALGIQDRSPDALNLAGVLFEMREDYTRAERYYKQALRIDKNHEAAQGNMRRIFELFHFGSSKEPFYLGRPREGVMTK